MKISAAAVALSLLIIPPQPAQARTWCAKPLDAYDDSVIGPSVTLSGVVVDRWDWGPPNFGADPQHDRRWRPTFLRLDRRTHFKLLGNRDEEGQPAALTRREIQLRGKIEMDPKLRRAMLGRHVVVSGPLVQGSGPADVAEIYLEGQTLRLSGRTICKEKV